MNHEPSQDTLVALESLRRAVAKALERKRRLGQYAVIWQDGQIVKLYPIPEQTIQAREDIGEHSE